MRGAPPPSLSPLRRKSDEQRTVRHSDENGEIPGGQRLQRHDGRPEQGSHQRRTIVPPMERKQRERQQPGPHEVQMPVCVQHFIDENV